MNKENEIYLDHRCRIELERASIDGFIYHIVTYGTHPCCYVEIPEGHRYFGKEYDDIDIACHGGLTYSDKNNWFETKHGWTIGWDYAHLGDYYCMHTNDYTVCDFGGSNRMWTVDELRDDVKDVIDQLKEE